MSGAPQPPEPPAPPPPFPPPRPAPRTGRLALGILLVLFGAGWLLDVLDVTDLAWGVLLPCALVVIGLALVVTARSSAGHGGLVAAGTVLMVVLIIGSAVDFPYGGGVGDRGFAPTTESELREGFDVGIGRLTIDLRGLPLDLVTPRGTVRSRVRVGIGKLLVIVPDGAQVRVRARAGLGNVDVFDEEEGGFDVEVELLPAAAIELDLSVGLGEVEVRRG
jgi:hypothetical protein